MAFPQTFYRRLWRGRLPESATEPYRADYTKGACVVFRRAALEQVGLFDQQYWMFAEEMDLFRRLADAGWEAWVVPDAVAVHGEGRTTRNHPDRTQSSRFRVHSYKSLCRFWRKHYALPDRLLLRAEMIARVKLRLGGAMARAAVGRGDPWWVGEHLRCLAALCRPWPNQPDEPRL